MPDRYERPRSRDVLGEILDALRLGAVSGATANFADELSGNSEAFKRAKDDQGLAYMLGEFGGAFAPAFAGAGLAKAIGGGMGAKGRLLTALLFGAGHGAAAGAGGYTPGNLTGEERLRDAAIGAGIGGALGGLGVPSARAARDVADNLPAMLGRVRQAEGGVTQAAPFTGTRGSAPLEVSLATEGATPAQRAQNALKLAMRMDEGEAAALTGGGAFGRFSGEAREVVPFQTFDRAALEGLKAKGLPQPGRTTASLIDYAVEQPGSRAALIAEADAAELGALSRYVKATRPKKLSKEAPRNTTQQNKDVKEVSAFFHDPQYTDAFLAAVKKMNARQRNSLARAVVRDLKSKVKETTPEGASALRRYLEQPHIEAKLAALMQKSRKNAMGAADGEVNALRARARPAGEHPAYGDSARGFRNVDDRLLASQGRMNPDDAAALMAAARSPQAARYLQPALPTERLLSGAYQRGVRMNPADWFGPAEIGDLMASVKFAQPVAAAAPGLLDYMLRRREAA